MPKSLGDKEGASVPHLGLQLRTSLWTEKKGVKGEKKNLSLSSFSSLVFAFRYFPFNPVLCVGGRFLWNPLPRWWGHSGCRAVAAAGTGHAPFTFVVAAINSACLS